MDTDKEIAEDVKHDGRAGQIAMIDRYGQTIYAMIARQVPNAMDAEELTQDTFLKAFSHISSYDPERASLITWLYRIAYRLTLDFLKRKKLFTVSIDDGVTQLTHVNDEQLEAELSTGKEERISRLETMIDDLPPDERLLLTMHYYENRPLTECAFIMDTTPHALANRLCRIRKKLYKQF